jgi:nucleoside-diphosphate-sugar epimerase
MEEIIGKNEQILVTGANGFIGAKVVESLLRRGFRKITCMVRSAANATDLQSLAGAEPERLAFVEGNLLQREDCARGVAGAAVIYHLAASADKSFAGSYFSTVVSTRQLLDAAVASGTVKRVVNVSSFAIYSNWELSRGAVLDETCPVEAVPHLRHEPYCYAKAKQEELVREYMEKHNLPVVIVRPGAVYGPRAGQFLTPRVGIDTFGFFLHLGGSNEIPLTYVDNCADGIVLAGLVAGVQGEVFNLVDDDLPASRTFLRMYKQGVGHFRSLFVPYPLFYLFSYLWEKYSTWSAGQFQPVFNRRRAAAYWKGNRYSNAKAKSRLGWSPSVPFAEAASAHFAYFKAKPA